MEYQQLKIDIATKDGITVDMYKKICKLIHAEGGAVLDDGHAPYTESLEAYYGKEELKASRQAWEELHGEKADG